MSRTAQPPSFSFMASADSNGNAITSVPSASSAAGEAAIEASGSASSTNIPPGVRGTAKIGALDVTLPNPKIPFAAKTPCSMRSEILSLVKNASILSISYQTSEQGRTCLCGQTLESGPKVISERAH